MELKVITYQGHETGRTVTLPEAFVSAPVKEHIVHAAVRLYLANQRQGTHATKEKGDVSASTRKLYRQKGTGNARAGSAKSSVRRGGGTTFGPQPRDYGFKLNKKEKKQACQQAFLARLRSGDVLVLEEFSFPAPQTKLYLEMLTTLGVEGHRSLLLLAQGVDSLRLSARNLPRAEVALLSHLHIYQLVKAGKLLLEEKALHALIETFS